MKNIWPNLTLNKKRIKGKFLYLLKIDHKKLTVNIIFDNKRLNAFFPRSETINKTLSQLRKKKRMKTQLTNIRKKGGHSIQIPQALKGQYVTTMKSSVGINFIS